LVFLVRSASDVKKEKSQERGINKTQKKLSINESLLVMFLS